jgi:hypothetical protein
LIATPLATLTHAITIDRPRREVWPWLLQMGSGRAGWYSYDALDNAGRHSADVVVSDYLNVNVGTIMPALPGETGGFSVLYIDPLRVLVLGWVPAAGEGPIVTWAFVLEEPRSGSTRLIVRARGSSNYRPPFGLPRWSTKAVMPLVHFVMQRRQLLGIAERAESAH